MTVVNAVIVDWKFAGQNSLLVITEFCHGKWHPRLSVRSPQ